MAAAAVDETETETGAAVNSFTCWGNVVVDPTIRYATPDKLARVEFHISTPSRATSKPMKFFATAIGKVAEKAMTLRAGEQILASGRLEPLLTRDGKFGGFSLLLNGIERFTSPVKEGVDVGPWRVTDDPRPSQEGGV